MREITYRPRAVADLEGIVVYLAIEQGSPQAAERAIERILADIERAAAVPIVGRLFVDEGLSRDYRRIRSGSYWVYYSFDKATITVWRVYHTARDTDAYGFMAFD